MNKPLAATLRADSRIDWAGTFNLPAPSSGTDPLTEEIDLAWVYIGTVSGREPLDSYTGTLEPLITYAVKLRVIQQAAQQVGTYNDIFGSISGITSFSVPGYSETRANQMESSKNGDQRNYRYNPWRPLDEIIHLIATQDARDAAVRALTMTYTPSIAYEHMDEQLPIYGIERYMRE